MRYKITAWMVCHDIRFTDSIYTTVEAEDEPTEQEIVALLAPSAEEVLKKNDADGYPYDIFSIRISKPDDES